MRSLEQLEQRLDRLRERDRVAASIHGKQRMMDVFTHAFDDAARSEVEARLRVVFDEIRAEAKEVALELAKLAFVELRVDDLVRINGRIAAVDAWLTSDPGQAVSGCQDLLTFIRDLRTVEGRGPPPRDEL